MLMRITSRVRLEETSVVSSKSSKFSRVFKDMVSACLCQEPAKRPSVEKLVRHPFFKACHRRSRDFLLEPVVTTEFTILELAYSRPSSLPRACAPTGLRSTRATTYKALGLTQPKRLA